MADSRVYRRFAYAASGLFMASLGAVAVSNSQVEYARAHLSRAYVATNAPTGIQGFSPSSYIGGSKTHIRSPFGLVVDKIHREVVVANRGTYHGHSRGSLVRMALGQGDVPAESVIQCQNFNFAGVTLDAQGNIVAADSGTNSVETFGRNMSGCISPLSQVGGSNTGIDAPIGVAFDSQRQLVVENFNSGIEVFAAGAQGNVAPIAAISGSQTGLAGAEGLAIDRDDNLYAAIYSTGTILEFSAGSNGNIAPARVISGPNTMLKNPIGVAVDRRGAIYVADFGRGAMLEFSPNANGNAAPRHVMPLSEPTAIAVP
jgi:hypothetical protein